MSGKLPGATVRLQLARRFIDEYFDQPIDLDVMARQAGLWFSMTERKAIPEDADQ
jgi:hypothetical protein